MWLTSGLAMCHIHVKQIIDHPCTRHMWNLLINFFPFFQNRKIGNCNYIKLNQTKSIFYGLSNVWCVNVCGNLMVNAVHMESINMKNKRIILDFVPQIDGHLPGIKVSWNILG